MDKGILKTIGRIAILGVIWTIILYGIAVFIVNSKGYNLKDVLFIEGLIVTIGGLFFTVADNRMGLLMQGVGKEPLHFHANLATKSLEENKTKRKVNTEYLPGLALISLIVGGVLIIILNFII